MVRAESWVASYDAKRLRWQPRCWSGTTPVAKGESLYLHVDTTVGKVTAFPPTGQRCCEQATAHDDAESA